MPGVLKNTKVVLAVLIIVMVAVSGWVGYRQYQAGADERRYRAAIEAIKIENGRKLQDIEAEIKSGNLTKEEEYDRYVKAALFAADHGRPESKEYAQKALDLKSELYGDRAIIADTTHGLLVSIVEGNYDASAN